MIKFLGAFFGLYYFGLLGAVGGYFLGAYISRSFAMGGRPMDGFANIGQRNQCYFSTTFSVMGHLAKADGHISKEEIQHAEGLMVRLGLAAEQRQEAIDLFQQGAATGFDLNAQLEQFVSQCGRRTNLSNMLLVTLVTAAFADGELHPGEQSVLQHVGAQLGFSRSQFERMLGMIGAQQGFRSNHHQQYQQQGVDELAQAYKALGIDSSVDDRVLKRAYRKLISQHHPDKLIAQGLPDDMIALATEKSQEIQSAYDLLEKHRKSLKSR